MSEMIRIRSIPEYFQEFAENGIGKGMPVEQVKTQIMEAFRKEIFDQITWRLKISDIKDADETPENHRIIENIMKQSYKKWLGLIKLFNCYRETLNVLKPEDLKLFDPQREMYDPFDGFDEDEEEENDDDLFEEAEDPEEEADGGLAEGADGEGSDQEASTVPSGGDDDGDEVVTSGYVEVVQEPVYTP